LHPPAAISAEAFAKRSTPAFTRRCLGHDTHSLRQARVHALPEQFTGNVETVRKTGQDRDAKIPLAGLNVSQSLPVDVGHLRQALLGQMSGKPSLANIPADQVQYLGVRHP
jgi:hypothetical protein